MRLDAGSIPLKKELIPWGRCCSARRRNSRRAQREGKRIRWEGLRSRSCATAWTSEAVGNLVKNALDHHGGAGGEVCLSWQRSPLMLRLVVSDNGCGILRGTSLWVLPRQAAAAGGGGPLPLAKSIGGQGGILTVESAPAADCLHPVLPDNCKLAFTGRKVRVVFLEDDRISVE